MPDLDLTPLGDRAFLARFGSPAEARAWADAARSQAWPGITDVVLAYDSVGVYADPGAIDLDEDLPARLRGLIPTPSDRAEGGLVEIPTLYDGEDLAAVAEARGLAAEAVVALHSGRDYDVLAVGFLPGFPYAGWLPGPLRGFARRAEPRVRVPAGSVAITGGQTAIYPRESPGGWLLLGRTPLVIADPRDAFFPIRPGDRLRFVPIGPDEFAARHGERVCPPSS